MQISFLLYSKTFDETNLVEPISQLISTKGSKNQILIGRCAMISKNMFKILNKGIFL